MRDRRSSERLPDGGQSATHDRAHDGAAVFTGRELITPRLRQAGGDRVIKTAVTDLDEVERCGAGPANRDSAAATVVTYRGGGHDRLASRAVLELVVSEAFRSAGQTDRGEQLVR